MPVQENAFRADPGAPSSNRLGDTDEAPRLPHQSTVRFHRVTSADGTLIEAWHNEAWHRGGDGPVVLLCNGLGTNAYSWPDLLRDDCPVRVISWNHRGVGRSARPSDPDRCGVDAFVEDAIAVMDAAGVESAVLAGWSIGVNTAFELAVRHPQRVKGIFAVAGVPGGTFESMFAPMFVPRALRKPLSITAARTMKAGSPVLTPVARRIPMGPISTTVLRWSGFMMPFARGEHVRRTVREFLTTPVDWYMHLALHSARHLRVSLSKVDVPCAFVGAQFDILASTRDMRTAADRIPGASYVNLFGTHFLTLERPRQITSMLLELCERVEAAA
ncbi:alpha/beta fold hydrolase [Nocardioides marmoribigeumensis]|uniref:Pimeloyl-ACP methyl ester carboxylesterase n=1 Tax=Nocardioides marmoribigeumensis TaxID=433649 RepID=A0ABU2BSF5_9ACTN|nr:alpha/beta hydrolase [Nocardioides marmoribigeumensis]MDR7361563.1 pimeloyl-ACP methyl ester carboxylesterase [Nocardioides marmoribigeumensis]